MMKTSSVNPLVSVLIIAYNHEKYINQAIESVFSQTYPKVELIVVDNDSQDKSARIIKSLQKEYLFRFVQQENTGAPRTMNRFIPQLHGKYYMSFSGDDYLPPDRIQLQVEFMEQNPQYAMCYGRSIFVDEESREIYRNDNRLFKGGWIFKDLIHFKFHPPAPTYFFRRDIFEKIGMYPEDLMYIEDLYMNLKVARHFQVGFIDAYLAFQRKHSQNLTFNADRNTQIKEGLLILRDYRDLPDYSRIKREYYLHCFAFLALHNPRRAMRYMLYSMPLFYKKKYIKSSLRMISGLFKYLARNASPLQKEKINQ